MNLSKQATESYIKIPNYIFDKLSPDEYYIYCRLRYDYIMYTSNCTKTNIDILSQQVIFYAHQTRNKNYIQQILSTLCTNNFINIHYEGELKNYTLLNVTFTDINPTSEYTILDNKFIDIDDPQALCVIANIKRWQDVKNKTFSLAEWADKIKVSERTMQRIFERMEESNLLRITSGEYYRTAKGELRQENNKYYLVDNSFDSQQIDTNVDVNTATEKKVELKVLTGEKGSADVNVPQMPSKMPNKQHKITDPRVLERDNLIRDDVKMEDEDFYIYVTTDDPVVKRLADAKFKRISGTERGKAFIDNCVARAMRERDEVERHKRQQDVWMNSAVPPSDGVNSGSGSGSSGDDFGELYKQRQKREKADEKDRVIEM